MGNQCASNCQYSCCDVYYNCVTNVNNCYYFYYNWTWVYIVCGVCLGLFILFAFIGAALRRRRMTDTIVVDTNDTTSYMVNGQGTYRGGVGVGGAPVNNMYNGGYNYNNNVNNNQNYMGQNNRQVGQEGYQMGQPVFLSDNQNQVYK